MKKSLDALGHWCGSWIVSDPIKPVFACTCFPEQVRLLPVTDEVLPSADTLLDQLSQVGVRATVDRSGDRLGKLIRTVEQMKIPVLAVIGAKEAERDAVSLRSRRDGDLGETSVAELLAAAQRSNSERLPGLVA